MCQETARSALPWDHPRQMQWDPEQAASRFCLFCLRGNALEEQGDLTAALAVLLLPWAAPFPSQEAAFCSVHLEQPHFTWHSLVVSSHPRHPPAWLQPRERSKSWLWTSRFLSAL